MLIIRHINKTRLKKPVVALGNFDGVHLGHKKILLAAVRAAKRTGSPSVALTFDPHPQQVVSPERGLRLLTTLSEREKLIAELGIAVLVIIRFNNNVRKLSWEAFVRDFLVQKLGVSMVFVGYDYAFGKGREGDVSHLRELSKKYAFKINVIKPVHLEGNIIKSKKIRELVSIGKFGEAVKMLGHPYIVSGKVVRGKGRGRKLGFPTANIRVDEHKLMPAQGVYAGVVKIINRSYKCVVNVGLRPTFPGDGGAFEVHILNFKSNILGRSVEARLLYRLRDEIQFSDVSALIDQIKKDAARASRLIKNRLYKPAALW